MHRAACPEINPKAKIKPEVATHTGEIERGEISSTLDSVQLIAAALDVQPSHLVALAEDYSPSG